MRSNTMEQNAGVSRRTGSIVNFFQVVCFYRPKVKNIARLYSSSDMEIY